MNKISQKERGDFKNSIILLGSFLELYEKGDKLMYLPMATELRKLFFDNQSKPLIVRIIPDINLHKLHLTEILENSPSLIDGLENFIPGKLGVSQYNVPILGLSFSNNKEKLNFYDWINQIFFKEKITILELIKSVADKQSVHSDKNYNNTLLHCKNWSYNDTECHILGVYGISRYVHDFINIEYNILLL